MKLDSMNCQRPVLDPHDFIDGTFFCFGPGTHLEAIRQGSALSDQRMVAGRCKRVLQAGKDTCTAMMDLRSFSVHDFFRVDHPATKRLRNALMPKADTQNRDSARIFANASERNPSLIRCAGPGRNDDVTGIQGCNLLNGDRIVSNHFDLLTQLPAVLHQVVGERIVVIDHQNHKSSKRCGRGAVGAGHTTASVSAQTPENWLLAQEFGTSNARSQRQTGCQNSAHVRLGSSYAIGTPGSKLSEPINTPIGTSGGQIDATAVAIVYAHNPAAGAPAGFEVQQ